MEELTAYRQYFDAMPCYVTVQDRELDVVTANQRFRDDFGEFVGRKCFQVYKQRSERCEVCPVDRTFRDGLPHQSEEQVQCLSGRKVSVLVNTTPVRNDAGEVTAVLEMSTDITDLKTLQHQLRDSQERYHLLFEEVPCFISIQDRDLRIVEANRRFREDFGSFLGCRCYEIYKHRQEECIPCPVQQVFADGQIHHSEEVVTSKSGESRNVLVFAAPLHDGAGGIRHVMEMSADITPIRQLQSQLESMGLLISSISHGIKGLLTGLDGGIYLVSSALAKNNPERLNQGWEMVRRNVERIRSMVLNILYYAKDREPQRASISASDLGREVLGIIEPKAREMKVELKQRLDLDVGNLDADANGLRALLINLLENSLEACAADKKKPSHWTELGIAGDSAYVRFEVCDNGIGMDQETREKAFSLFFSSKGAKGTGLGLFIANNIARAHGGSIQVESEIGEGTRLIVKLPRGAPPTAAQKPAN
jgi:PAS domain S-box-containing protein